MPLTRTRSGSSVPAGSAGPPGENVNEVPDASMLTSPGPGDAVTSVSATVPTSTSVAPARKPAPATVNGPAPVSIGPSAGLT